MLYIGLPKADLHLRLEGWVDAETRVEIAPRLPPADVRDVYVYSDFIGFLKSYAWVSKRLTRPEHYGTITTRLLERLVAQSVLYVEINLSVGVILWKEQDFTHIYQAVREAAERSPVEVHWIFDAVRQFGAESAMQVPEPSVRHATDGGIGF